MSKNIYCPGNTVTHSILCLTLVLVSVLHEMRYLLLLKPNRMNLKIFDEAIPKKKSKRLAFLELYIMDWPDYIQFRHERSKPNSIW